MGFPSLYRLYLEMGDVLEYNFSKTYLGGWEHWQKLQQCTWFKPYLKRWREELELKIRSEALTRLATDATSSSRSSASSNRYLLDRGWAIDKNEKGRPSKEQIKEKAKEMAEFQTQLDTDLLRITKTALL